MSVEFTIPAWYYARQRIDWDSAVPARGYAGEQQAQIALSTANTAIVCIHCPNTGFGYPEAPEYICDPAVMPYFHDVDERRKVMVQNRMAPFFETARSIGMRIMYGAAGWPCAKKYESWREISSRVPPKSPSWTPPEPPGTAGPANAMNPAGGQWRTDLIEQSGCTTVRTSFDCDFPNETGPTDRDWVITSTPQASTILNENGIWNILLVGTDATGCLLTSYGALLPMAALGFRIIGVEDCTESGEFPETRETRGMRWAMLRTMQLFGKCYLTDSISVNRAINEAGSEGRS